MKQSALSAGTSPKSKTIIQPFNPNLFPSGCQASPMPQSSQSQSSTPKLDELAKACFNGACNPYALIKSLGEAIGELQPFEIKSNTKVKIIVGQISFLLGESLGPTETTIAQYKQNYV